MKSIIRTFYKVINLFFLTLLVTNVYAENISVSGKVFSEDDHKPLQHVNIIVNGSNSGCATNHNGHFSLVVEKLPIQIIISHIAYQTKEIEVFNADIGVIYLKSKVLAGENVIISATRAVEGKTPIAFSTLTTDEISTRYTIEDVPMILAMEPGVYAYSESGNGTGYAYVSIRGFDQSRIAVMLDGVSLNDNESHQVYWVDHNDILSNVQDVQIQRGIGNSLYGAAAFGGSINVTTKIASEKPGIKATIGSGSYNTQKYRVNLNSGKLFGDNLSVTARFSNLNSEGYRQYHDSKQNNMFVGVEHRTKKLTNQFRALIGYENTDLTWDGISDDNIDDRKKRRESYKAYTDDFLQQIYSLNTLYHFKKDLVFRNTAYLVKGQGYYEVFKTDRDYYSYNLDISGQYADTTEQNMQTDLLRRKWIVNNYYGIIPRLTFEKPRYRLDIGGEFRSYAADHFGEVSNFSNQELSNQIGDTWHEYYDYIGEKKSSTFFIHCSYLLTSQLRLIGDIQYQYHQWTLHQEKIGHAMGYDLSTDWKFLNPRLGAIFSFSENFSIFANYGKAQKEPADNQIIEADDVWSRPVTEAAAEVIDDYEFGLNFNSNNFIINTNLYRINFYNEQLKEIDSEQEGEYNYYSADKTIHQGIEFEIRYSYNKYFSGYMNGTISKHYFSRGINRNNLLPNVPSSLLNCGINTELIRNLHLFANLRYVGKQFLNAENVGRIKPYFLVDLGGKFQWEGLEISAKINNLFDILYSTYGYGYWWDENFYSYYWPGATRNIFLSVSYSL